MCVYVYVSISLVLLSACQTTERKSFHSWSRDGDGGGGVERERMDMGWVESRQPREPQMNESLVGRNIESGIRSVWKKKRWEGCWSLCLLIKLFI